MTASHRRAIAALRLKRRALRRAIDVERRMLQALEAKRAFPWRLRLGVLVRLVGIALLVAMVIGPMAREAIAVARHEGIRMPDFFEGILSAPRRPEHEAVGVERAVLERLGDSRSCDLEEPVRIRVVAFADDQGHTKQVDVLQVSQGLDAACARTVLNEGTSHFPRVPPGQRTEVETVVVPVSKEWMKRVLSP